MRPENRSPRSRLVRASAVLLPLTAVTGATTLGQVRLPSSHAAPAQRATLAAAYTAAPVAQAPTGPGSVGAYGQVPALSGPGSATSAPIVGMASTPTGQGYWLAGADGSVYPYGDARSFGSMPGATGVAIVGIAATPDGGGYWLVGANGSVFSFGDAGYHGGLVGVPVGLVVGIASSPSGNGYWIASSHGGVFSFGDAPFQGSMGGIPLAESVTGIAAAPNGSGYWLFGATGGVYAFGAGFYGSMAGRPTGGSIIGMAPSPTSGGYSLVSAGGAVFSFGDASFPGSAFPVTPTAQVSAVAASPTAQGLWMATQPAPPPPPPPPPPAPAPVVTTVPATSSSGRALGNFVVTCYDLNGVTASGAYTNSSTVAVDPSVIPMGSEIYIQGVGNRIAQDTGGAIRGRRLDIWEPSYSDCINFGAETLSVTLVG